MNSDLMFSSKTDIWATPKEFFDSLDKVFRFETDVCAVKDNAKCQRFYTTMQTITNGKCAVI